jgi:hypothetical protein
MALGWRADYSLRLEIEGQSSVYAWRMPDDVRSSTYLTLIETPALRLAVTAETTCTEQRSGDAISRSCTPIPDHYLLTGTVSGTPANLHLVLARDGTTVLDTSVRPVYSAAYPNGPECGPVCRQASWDTQLP